MDFKKGNWAPGQAFDIDNANSDLIDDKMQKKIVNDLKS